MRDIGHRLCGLGVLSAAGITTMVHRSVYELNRNGPATVAEFALGLATFMLGCFGVLLLLHGNKLLARDDCRAVRAAPEPSRNLRSMMMEPIEPAGRVYDTRYGALLMKERHAIASAKVSAGRRMLAEQERRHHESRATVRPTR